MARKSSTKDVQVLAPASQMGEIIPEGDFAGMTYNEVLDLTHAALEDALGPLSIVGALAAQDRLLAQSLELAAYVEGDKFAHEAALKIAQTVLPYIQVENRIYEQAYREIVKMKGRIKLRKKEEASK